MIARALAPDVQILANILGSIMVILIFMALAFLIVGLAMSLNDVVRLIRKSRHEN
jgi:hypothetical protein